MTQLAPARIELSEFKRNHFQVRPEPGTKIEEVLADKYWAHVSAKLKRGDRIEVLPDDDAYFAEVLVLDAGKLYAKVGKLIYAPFYADLKDAATKAGEFSIQWRGPSKRWCGYCGDDELAEKMTRDTANDWLGQRASKSKAA